MASTISIDSIDFSNVQFNTPQFDTPQNTNTNEHLFEVSKSTNELIKHKRGTNPSINKLYDIIDTIDKVHNGKDTIPQDLQNQINLYAKGSNEQAKKQCYDKINIINQQESNYDCLLTYADTTRFKSSFNYPNIATYNYLYFNESTYQNVINGLDQFNYTEQIYLSDSRIFFDIDYSSNKNTIEELIQLLNFIEEFTHSFSQSTEEPLIPYGIIEYSHRFNITQLISVPLFQEHVFNPEQSKITIMIFENTHPEFTKDLSTHIYLNGYAPRDKIERYMKNYIPSDFCPTLFDRTIYKTTKQALRQSFSPKVDVKAKTVRPLSDNMIPFIKEYYNNPIVKNIILNLRGAPMISDILINLPEPQFGNQNSKAITNSSKKSKINEINPSIYQFISISDEQKGIEFDTTDIGYLVQQLKLNNYEFHQKTFQLITNCVLTEEEFREEFYNIQLPTTNQYSASDNEDFLNKVYQLKGYKQDLSNMRPLYSIKAIISHGYLKIKAKKPDEITPEDIIMKKKLKYIKEKVNCYIDKYSQISFCAHSDKFFNVFDFKPDMSKREKLLYNCFINVDNNFIYYPFKKVAFKDITQFRTYFKMNGKKANEIRDLLTVFMNEKDYKRKSIKYKYSKLTEQQLNEYTNECNILLKYLESSFKYPEDFKLYISFYSSKFNQKTTLNKGIINQGTETTAGQDSLKTLFNDLLEDYIEIYSGDVNNLNKALNGTYFKGDLLVIEETPQNIKDKNNLINVLKMYSSKEYITVEEKGMRPEKIENKNDIIINSNYTLSPLFTKKQDCDALLKRFKIFTRQSLNMKDPELNRILDRFKKSNDKFILRHHLYKMIKHSTTLDYSYFIQHSRELNQLETLYLNSATTVSDSDKNETNMSLPVFKEWFKTNYIEKSNNSIVISKLLKYFQSNKNQQYKNMKQATFKSTLMRILNVGIDNELKMDSKGRLIMTNATDSDYEKIYTYFFEYCELETNNIFPSSESSPEINQNIFNSN